MRKNKAAATPVKSGAAGQANPEVVTDEAGAQKVPAEVAPLLGSSVLADIIVLGAGDGAPQISLGDLVAKAFTASGLTVAEWNAVAPDVRESLLDDELELLRSQVAAVEPAAEPVATAPVATDPVATEPGAQEVEFPILVTLRNHGRVSVTEPATGAFLCAGGSASVAVTSAAQLERMKQNIEHILSRPGARQSLTVSGLPKPAQ